MLYISNRSIRYVDQYAIAVNKKLGNLFSKNKFLSSERK